MRMLSSWEKKSLSEVVNIESMESGLKYHKEKTGCQDDRITCRPIFQFSSQNENTAWY